MTIRFILEVPTALERQAVELIESIPDAEAITVRRSDLSGPEYATTEISAVAESTSFVNRLYDWYASLEGTQPVFIDLGAGDRYRLDAYDADSLQHAIQADVLEMEPAPPVEYVESRAGNLVWEIPFGGRMTNGTALVPAETKVELGPIDHIALRVRDMARAERFYRTFFGMDVMYRAYRENNQWIQLDERFDWSESIHTGVRPEIVRLENGPVALVLVDIGLGHMLYENRIEHVSVTVTRETLAQLRGRALFNSFTVREDGRRSFQFADPFGIVWQLIADDTRMTGSG